MMHPLDYDFEQVRKIQALQRELNEVEQILGKALKYPRYADDPKNFPGATEADGVCVGEHTAATLAQEAAERLNKLDKILCLLWDAGL